MYTIIKKNRVVVIITSILLIIASLSNVIMTLMLARLFDTIVYSDIEGLIRQSLYLLIIFTVMILLNYLAGIKKADAIKKMNYTLRNNILKKLINKEYEEYKEEDTGNYVSWLTNDITLIENNGFENIFSMVSQGSTVIFSLCGLAYIHYSVLGMVSFLCIVIVLLPKLINKKIQRQSAVMSERQEIFLSKTKDNIMGYDVLYNYNLLNELRRRIIEGAELLETSKYKFRQLSLILEGLLTISNMISQLGLIIFTGYLSILGHTTIGEIIPAGNLAGSFFSSFSKMINCITIMKSTAPIFDKFGFDKDESINLLDSNGKELIFQESIDLKNIKFSYDNRNEILSDISLTFEKGKKYAIVGESGCGKTTLIKLILGHIKNYNGDIYIDNCKIEEYGQHSLRDNIAYISQNTYMFQDSIKNNIELLEKFDEECLKNSIRDSSLSEFIDSLENNVDTIIGEEGSNISGGQKQRIEIARALIRNKRILILDEGTSALDKENAIKIENKLLSNSNLTVIFITHKRDKDFLEKFDDIINLDEVNKLSYS